MAGSAWESTEEEKLLALLTTLLQARGMLASEHLAG